MVLQADGTERSVDVSSRAYEKLVVPSFPQFGDTKNWMTQLKRNVLAAAPYTDMAEINWLNECYNKTFEELVEAGPARYKRLDLMLGKCMATVIDKSEEPLSDDMFLADRDANDQNRILGGRQMIWMLLNFF